jgi:hypothetical protein
MGTARVLVVGTVVLCVGLGAGLVLSTRDGHDSSASGSTAVEGESATQRTPSTTSEPAPSALGDRVRSGGLQLILQAVTDPFEGADPVVTAPAGKRWVAADVQITNISDAPATLSGGDQFVLRDKAKARFGQADTAEHLASLDGVLSPGQTLRGSIVFELPEDAHDLRLVFTGAPGDAPPIVVSLG